MNRRSFMRFVSAGAIAAPAVKAVETLPDHQPEKFAEGPRPFSPFVVTDIQDALLYDRIRFPAGSVIPHNFYMFCTPIGQTCPYTNIVKTYRHTSMHAAGQLSAPYEFLAQRILFAVHPSAHQSDLAALSSASAWEFHLLNKIMWRGPMLLNGPARAGLRDVITPNGRAVNPLPAEVLNTARSCVLTRGVFIPSLCSFSVRLDTPDSRVVLTSAAEGGTGVDLLIAFQGAESRPVQ